jgi:hypothetical protein
MCVVGGGGKEREGDLSLSLRDKSFMKQIYLAMLRDVLPPPSTEHWFLEVHWTVRRWRNSLLKMLSEKVFSVALGNT